MKDTNVLIREGFWMGMGQIAAYSIIGLVSGLVVLAFLPDNLGRPCPKLPAASSEKKTGCGCGGH